MKITNEIREKIIMQAIETRGFAGFEAMYFLPKSMKKMDKILGRENMPDAQEFRALRTTYEDKNFTIILLDDIKKNTYECVWEMNAEQVTSYGYTHLKDKSVWRGFSTLTGNNA